MVESDVYSADLDKPATGITAVWVYFAITLRAVIVFPRS